MKPPEEILSEISLKRTGFIPADIDGKVWEEWVIEAIKAYASQDKGVCKWKTDESNEGFITNCGHELTIFNNSGDLDNDFKEIGYIYCPYCQLKIERI